MGEELVVLVLGVGGRDRVPEQAVEVRPGDPVTEAGVEVAQVLRAPLVVLRGLEVLVGQREVPAQLGVVVERLVVGAPRKANRSEAGVEPWQPT
ncbi:hypothetical protein ACWCOV_40900, partial [Kribbella sp. NPDC002412]